MRHGLDFVDLQNPKIRRPPVRLEERIMIGAEMSWCALRDVFPGDGPYRLILLDHDSTFDGAVIAFLKATDLDPTRTGVQAPWQNGIAERWVGSCRRELLDHIIALNERHLYRLIREYVAYHHDDRVHDALEKDAPKRGSVEPKPSPGATVTSTAPVGGFHHRYSWRDAA